MTYPEALDFLFTSLPVWEQKGAAAYKPGLERIAAFVDTLGLFSSKEGICEACAGVGRGVYFGVNDEPGAEYNAADAHFSRKPRFIHVAGTNGKGSTCHMLAAVLQRAGYRTGLFTSPHLVDFRERIRVDGEIIPREAVVEFTERWREEMTRGGLSFFEMTTAMAMWWFTRSECDVAVIETGLGGRLDSTNIITPIVSVVTNIGLEHTQYLGDTLAAIAAEKAGIIKRGVPVVVGERDPESEPVFRARAAETGSEIVFADGEVQVQVAANRRSLGVSERGGVNLSRHRREDDVVQGDAATGASGSPTPPEAQRDNYDLDLTGDYQQKNLATVLATVEVLRRTLDIPDDALHEGLANAAALTGLAGRWQVVGRDPLIVLDTAHNAHGLALVCRQIARKRRGHDKLFMVMGFAGDKDLDAIAALLPRDAHYILTQAATPRAMPADELARRLADQGTAAPAAIETTDTVPAAIRRAISLAGPRDMIFVGGSNFVVGEAIQSLTKSEQSPIGPA